jgi:uncharacterized protein (UPF0335 family)
MTTDQPRRRVEYYRNERQKRKFGDGAPQETASKKLKRVVEKVQQRHVYSELGPGEDIRVLVVEKGAPDENIRCNLVTSSLPPPKDKCYEALSYYWGNDEKRIKIDITSYNNSTSQTRASFGGVQQKKFWIRSNLHDALKELRSTEHDVTLWVDAICINQENKAEKTEQISKMHEIYSQAYNVCIWLGVGEEDAESNKQMFRFIRQTLDLRRLDQLVASENSAKQWLAFVQLMRNRWFSRRWVVQEVSLFLRYKCFTRLCTPK